MACPTSPLSLLLHPSLKIKAKQNQPDSKLTRKQAPVPYKSQQGPHTLSQSEPFSFGSPVGRAAALQTQDGSFGLWLLHWSGWREKP